MQALLRRRSLLAGLLTFLALGAQAIPDPHAVWLDPDLARFRSLQRSDGLSQISVLSIAQDAQGMLWFGTQRGLNRFDGFEMRVFGHGRKRSERLSDLYINRLQFAADGQLWIATRAGGLNRFDPRRERFFGYRRSTANSNSLPDDNVQALLLDGNGVLWIGGPGGLAHWRPVSDDFQTHSLRTAKGVPVPDPGIVGLTEAANGALWLAMGDGVRRFDPVSGQLSEPLKDREGHLESPKDVSTMMRDRRGRLWIGSLTGGLYRYDPDRDQLRQWRHQETDPHSLPSDRVMGLLEDRAGRVWIGTVLGAALWVDPDAEPAQFLIFSHRPHDPDSLSNDRVIALHEGTDGDIWFGTYAGGANLLSSYRNRFLSYGPEQGATAGLPSPDILSLAAAEPATLWVGTSRGLFNFDIEQRSLLALPNTAHLTVNRILPEAVGLLLGDLSGVYRYRAADKPLLRLSTTLGALDIRVLQRDGERLWVCCAASRLWLLDVASGAPLASQALQKLRFVAMLDAHTVLTGGPYGLHWLDRESAALRFSLNSEQQAAYGLSSTSFTAMHRDRRGRIWLGTSDAGLLQMHLDDPAVPGKAHFSAFPRPQAVHADTVGTIIEDASGKLWMNTERGIARFDPDTLLFTEFGPADGALDSYNFKAVAQWASGWVAVGGAEGFTLFNPAHLTPLPAPPKPLLTALLLDHQPVDPESADPGAVLRSAWDYARSLRLPAVRARSLGIGFTSPDYIAPQQLRFAYRLDGFDRDWVETDAGHRVASYTNLPAGEYRFRVRARNAEGLWSEDSDALAITLVPRWFETGMARVFALLLLSAAVYATHRLRLMGVDRQRQRLAALVDLRTTELTQSIAREHEHEHLLVREKMASATQMTAGLAHEINNPVNFVYLAAQNLEVDNRLFHQFLNELAADAGSEVLAAFNQRFVKLQGHIDTILDGNRRVRDIVEDLRRFSRLDAAEAQLLPVGELLEATLRLVGAKYRQRIAIECDLAVDPPIRCFPARLNQAFMNLIVNACHAIASRSEAARIDGIEFRAKLSVISRVRDGELQIAFEDNGCGIAAAVRERIFEPFFTTKPPDQGTGLGLAVSLGIIKEHGGRIELESTPGEGTCFTVCLALPRPETAAS